MSIVGFLPVHPHQLWIMKSLESSVNKFARVAWVLRDKDGTEELARLLNIDYVLLSRSSTGLIGNSIEYFSNVFSLQKIARRYNIDAWFTKYGAASLPSRLLGKRSIAFDDDDPDVTPLAVWSHHPFSNIILTPSVTRRSVFNYKTLRYPSYHELFYLHPNRFIPDSNIYNKMRIDSGTPYALIRLSAYTAHHDMGKRGFSRSGLRSLVKYLKGRMKVFISSEGPLPSELADHRLRVSHDMIHHVLAFAEIFIGDSQTMTAEASVLGVPALRLSDFVGRISYLEELQDYGLCFGFKPYETDKLMSKVRHICEEREIRHIFMSRRKRMLEEKIDPVPLFAETIRRTLEGESVKSIMKLGMAS